MARPSTAQKDDDQIFVRQGADSIGARQIVLVPGGSVPLVALDLPDRLRGQAREQVARRKLADRLGLRPEQIAMRPFSVATRQARPEAWDRVLTAEKGWLDGLHALPGRAVLPDYLSLPTAPNLWTVQETQIAGHPQIMLRFGPQDGMTAQPALALAALRRALAKGPLPKAIYAPAGVPAGLGDLAAEFDVALAQTKTQLVALDIAPVVLGFGELSCDLRKNPMAARARLADRVLPWRWTALAGGLAAALWAAVQVVGLQRAEARTQELTAQTTALVQQHFTDGGAVLDARLQVSRALAQMQSQTAPTGDDRDPLDLIHSISGVLRGAQVTPELVEFRAEEGLRVIASLPDFAAADRLAAALRADGLTVDMREARTEDGEAGVRAEFAIGPNEAPPQ
ncbi:type II secretion system protein GspL [Tropicibacter oceani]|uniref:Type II secretion system protein GspL n=1 Tax=Tropicibacter oceani TaxID=3058420 RepID=A0ABY8QMQ1_9RHOB|nr:type II secretion system protein GspL [Tropicibacter oceani]WGW05915.1 type II secretion system protein GspL [Tropicibacter oceani]